ncbi:hypothetical protein N7509_009600 [Penicillium cosmopolitanum]|uniref:Wax synthase domain-containing protein n=1 Tax=Penicillium cosmopolitanum TaxID=1131564 RepID=A0A9W9VPX4_9EURO|nr:uncharacterized protein N7509_009600 [Penicillium cosmopolitanum]KAJ5387059.1 hypothetical protein N7509_009600 [Penicillium cosmopolitanum]
MADCRLIPEVLLSNGILWPGAIMDQPVASTWANILEILLLYTAHVLLPTILLLATAKRSLLRYLSIPVSLCILHRAIHIASLLGPGFIWCELARLFLTVACQSLNLLLINSKDGHDIPDIGQGYLALDMFSTLALRQAMEQEKFGTLPSTVHWNISIEQLIERIVSNLMAGFVVSRILIDFHHRVFSVIAVGIGLDSTSDWPPLFGKATDTYSLRGFWSKFWHQLLQQPLTSISRLITRDVLGLAPNSTLRRYMNICIVFFLSGGLHVVLDIVQGIPSQESGAMLFFALAPLGLMIEDAFKALWRLILHQNKESKTQNDAPLPRSQRILGLAWTMLWLGVTSTWYFYPQMLRPQNQNLVPFSFADQVGLPVTISAVTTGGVMLAFTFQVEV